MRELIVDCFAGGGGASTGIKDATGREPDVAINHDPLAIAMHKANHPKARHFTEDVWRVDPADVVGRRRVGLLWASPDCRHFSRAKGGKPVAKKIRALAWVVVRWALLPRNKRPRVIILENVREFQDWGPLLPMWRCRACQWRGTEGQTALARTRRRCPSCNSWRLAITQEEIPDPNRKGLTFKKFAGRLRSLGYQVGWKNLNAADFGAPTARRRLFLVARCDGLPIRWPEPTHAAPDKVNDQPLFGELKPYRTAAEIIDWSLPCRSIFDRKKPLAEKTMRRIALGLKRYVLDNPQPFIVRCNHGGDHFRGQSVDQPLCTLTAARDAHGLVVPHLVGVGGPGYSGKPRAVDRPLGTIIQENHTAIVAPTLIQAGYGERDGQEPRVLNLGEPLGTVVAGGTKHALVAAMLTKFNKGVIGHGLDRPSSTITAVDHHGLVAANLVKFRGDSDGASLNDPLPTITSGAGAARPAGAAHAMGIAAACLARFNHGDKQWNGMDEPLGTVTSQGNKFGLVYAFLVKYFGHTGTIGAKLTDPLHTITPKDRFGLVLVEVALGVFERAVAIYVPGVGPCIVADIGLRMLVPRELARGQGFPDSYVLLGSNSDQVAKIGNSVPPVLAQRMVEANYVSAGVLV